MKKTMLEFRDELLDEIEVLTLEKLKGCMVHKVGHVKSAKEWADIYYLIVQSRKESWSVKAAKELLEGEK